MGFRRVAALLAAVSLTACGSDADEPDALADDRWTELSPAPAEISEVAAAALDDRIWVVGGFSGSSSATTGTYVFDPASDSWESGPDLPAAVHHSAAAADEERLWVVGGYGPGNSPTDAVWTIEPGGDWEAGPALPEPRAAGALAWDGDRLVYAGGVIDGEATDQVLELVDGAWEPLGRLTEAREHLGAASDGAGSVWFLGGHVGALDTNMGTVDLVTGEEIAEVGEIPTARGGVAGFYAPGLGGCAVGGEADTGTFSEVECVSATGETAELPELAMPRHGLGAVVVDGAVYTLVGGPEPLLSYSDSVEALRLGG
ncbi:Kelch repeat-containing protein [Glycomyces xiaoerkulensis]|uniref:Kelch repeat-containing protein n=1 Tax=Glycomyces xiaoerkulensis TaxID=2038139 RepID=UPI000C266319|nr:kelch repeat-containing protein [Glycomyces xiaoerkulensis]